MMLAMGVLIMMVLIGTPVYLYTIGASPWIIAASAIVAGLVLIWLVWPSKPRPDATERARPADGSSSND